MALVTEHRVPGITATIVLPVDGGVAPVVELSTVVLVEELPTDVELVPLTTTVAFEVVELTDVVLLTGAIPVVFVVTV